MVSFHSPRHEPFGPSSRVEAVKEVHQQRHGHDGLAPVDAAVVRKGEELLGGLAVRGKTQLARFGVAYLDEVCNRGGLLENTVRPAHESPQPVALDQVLGQAAQTVAVLVVLRPPELPLHLLLDDVGSRAAAGVGLSRRTLSHHGHIEAKLVQTFRERASIARLRT